MQPDPNTGASAPLEAAAAAAEWLLCAPGAAGGGGVMGDQVIQLFNPVFIERDGPQVRD